MRIAFVAPFFGKSAAGGAEFAARTLAHHLADAGFEVDVLTTCLKDLPTGITNNVHHPGVYHDHKLTIRRFRAETPDMKAMGELNDLILEGEKLTVAEELQFMSRHVNSTELLRYIAGNEADYAWFCFIPYLFGTTCFGARVVPHKSIMIPCLHDEGYAGLEIVHRAICGVKRLVFNAPAEERFARRTYRIEPSQGVTIGLGVDTDDIRGDADRFRRKFKISDPFVLYVGRRDTTKNVHTLINYFEIYKQEHPGPLKLILIGPARLPVINPSDDIIDLGFVDMQDKYDAYAAAEVFCQPSLNESFSYVIMESWLCGTPCLVHEGCEVTRDHATDSGGGLYFRNLNDFNAALSLMLNDRELHSRMKSAGRRYVLDNYAWDHIIDRFKEEVFC